jgi:hypothetical protein
MKRFLSVGIIVLIILVTAGPAPARTRANGAVEYTFYSSEIDNKRSCRLIAGEKVKRVLAADMTGKLEQEARLNELRLTKDRAAALMTFIVQIEVLKEKWDGTTYTLTARAAVGKDDVLKNLWLLQKDKAVMQELFLSGQRADVILREIDDINRESRTTRVDRKKIDRYHRASTSLKP